MKHYLIMYGGVGEPKHYIGYKNISEKVAQLLFQETKKHSLIMSYETNEEFYEVVDILHQQGHIYHIFEENTFLRDTFNKLHR